MLDLKAKLLKAGLVTEEQVKKVEEEQASRGKKRKGAAEDAGAGWRKRLDELRAAGKSEQYDVIRGWVVRHRLDNKTAVPSENAGRFHFDKGDGAIGHVTLEPEVQQKLSAGEAGIIAFMGHNGLEHAVVPVDLARDIAHVRAEWLRFLAGVTPADDSPAPDGPAPDGPAPDGPAPDSPAPASPAADSPADDDSPAPPVDAAPAAGDKEGT